MAWPYLGSTGRPLVTGTRAMVACGHPLAAEAGISILRAGGNAVDAAVAVSAALGVVEPFMSGFGGGGGMLIQRNGDVTALHYGGTFPAKATLDVLTPAAIERGSRAMAVPGNPAGWLCAHERHGRLGLGQVFEPAIALARDGFALTPTGASFFKMAAGRLNDAARAVFCPDGHPALVGQVVRNPALAATMVRIADNGVDEFYRGQTADRLAEDVRAAGGFLSPDDLARPQAEWAAPTTATYRGDTLVSTGWPFTSYEVLAILGLLNDLPLHGGLDSADTWHALIEASKLAVADRVAFGGNSAHLALLSPDYLRERGRLIDPRVAALGGGDRYIGSRAPGSVPPGSPADIARECTTHFDVIDADGLSVSVTQTLGSVFGSGVMSGSTGILLNNLMYFFDLDARSPMSVGLGAMRGGPISPVMVFRDDRLLVQLGTPGAFGIPQTTAQMLSNVLDHQMNIQAAIESPRFRLYGGRRVAIETRVSPAVREALVRRGHQIDDLSAFSPAVGGAQGIFVDPDSGAFSGGADPRRDGYAIGF